MSNSHRQKPPRDDWAIYIRVSTRHQAEEGFSLQDQRERLIAHAEDRKWPFRVFEDAGESGESLEGRPGLVQVLELADAGEIVGVLVADESRLARDELIAALIRDRLKKTGTRLATPRGEHDLNDPTENFMANVLAATHAFEQDLRTEKMKIGLRKAALAGYWTGGPAPYGYRIVPAADGSAHKELAVNDAEADILKMVVDLIINKGHTTYSVATFLNEQGILTRRGRLWRHSNLRHHLRHERLTGRWTYKQGGEAIEVQIPTILTREEWEALQGAIKGRPRPQRKNRLYPLSGRGRHHLYCQCGANFFGMVRVERKRRAYYTCSRSHHNFGDKRCPHTPRTHRAIPLEEAVWDEVGKVLTDPDYLIELARTYLSEKHQKASDDGNEGRELQIRLDQLHNQETRIVRHLADEDRLDLLDRTLAEIANERQGLETRLDEIDVADASADISEHQLRVLAEQARRRFDDPTPELMAEVFDLLDIQLHRVAADRFEGTGTIPIPEDGEVWEEGPRRRGLRQESLGQGGVEGPI